MKKWYYLIALGVIMLGLAGCGQVAGPGQTVQQTKAAERSEPSQATQSKKAEKSLATKRWTAAQDADLAQFMASWQEDTEQQFQGTYDDGDVCYLGYQLPGNFESDMTEFISNNPVQMRWNDEDPTSGDYLIVAAAVGGHMDDGYPILYLFGVANGKTPQVLVTETTSGGDLYFYPTQNQALQAGFDKIVQKSLPAFQG